MAQFTSGGITLAYDDIGPRGGRPIVLLHGFASNRNEMWRRLGWYGAFERKGMRCDRARSARAMAKAPSRMSPRLMIARQ